MHPRLAKAKRRRVSWKDLVGAVFLASALSLVFWPRHYDVEDYVPRASTAYWQLSTGSRLGYTRLAPPPQVATRPTPLIYLHGGPGGVITDAAVAFFEPFAALGYEVYLYDQVGSGSSARLDDIRAYTVTRHVADLLEIIDSVGTPEVLLVGHSWGSVLLTEVLKVRPQRVRAAVLTGPGPILPMARGPRTVLPPDSLDLSPVALTNRQAAKRTGNLRSMWVEWGARRFGQKWATDQEMDAFFTTVVTALNRATFCSPGQAPAASPGQGYYAHHRTVKSFSAVPSGKDALA